SNSATAGSSGQDCWPGPSRQAPEDALWTELAQRPDSQLARWALWDLYSRSPCLATLPFDGTSAYDAAYSPNGSLVSIANRLGGKVEVWDAGFTKTKLVVDVKAKRSLCVAFSPDSRSLATGDSDGKLMLWSVEDGVLIASKAAHQDSIGRIAYSPDGSMVATAGRDSHVRLWDAKNAEMLKDLGEHKGVILSIAFSPDSRTILSGSEDNTMKVWDTTTGECRRTLLPTDGLHRRGTAAIAFSPDGRHVFSGGNDRTLKAWDAGSFECLWTRDDLAGYPYSIAVTADSGSMYLANDAVEVRSTQDG